MTLERKERITVTIDGTLLEAIDELAERRGESRSGLMERVLGFALEDYEKQMKELEGPMTRALFRALAKSPEATRLLGLAVGNAMTKEEAKKVQENLASDLEEAAKRKARRKAGRKKPGGKTKGNRNLGMA